MLDALDAAGIPYRLIEHGTVRTVADMERPRLGGGESIPQNFFLRKVKGRRHFLLAAAKDRIVRVPRALGTSALSFAYAARSLAGLEKGVVTPLGVSNDGARPSASTPART